MYSKKYFCGAFICLLAYSVTAINHGQAQKDWDNYKRAFGKDYTNTDVTEAYAQYYYNYNKNMINSHNNLQAAGRSTFTLRENQFTDMRLIHFNALLPKAINPAISNDVPPAAAQDAPVEYDPTVSLGLKSQVQDQGTLCSAGWAYAAAKSIEILQALQIGNSEPEPLSAQNFIDCAGSGTGCTTQAPQTAFDFLTEYAQDLHQEIEYPNNNATKTQGMCTPEQSNASVVTQLGSYARIADGDDATLKKYVAAGYPVVVEINPTSFEFMHYSSGVFQQPTLRTQGSHFLPIIGYGTDAKTKLDYWLAENSFGETWGENGYIRILRSPKQPIAKNAIFPYQFR